MTLLSGVVEPTTWRLEGGQKEYRWETEQIDWTTSEEQESANPRIIEQSTSTRNTIIYRFQTSINVQFRQRVQQHLSNMVCSTITDHEIGERLEALGWQKGVLMKSKEKKAQNTESINDLNIENE